MDFNFSESVFREYDIRGKAGSEITPEFAAQLGKAFCSLLLATNPDAREHPIIIGRDVRLSSPQLSEVIIHSVTASGFDVIDIGMVPTPLAYFSVFHMQAAGCIMVTASHNPGADNGFKIMKGRDSLHGDDIQEIRRRMQMQHVSAPQQGSVTSIDIMQDYLDFLCAQAAPVKPAKIVVDAGNGPTGIVAVPLLQRLGCEVIPLFCEPDGHFPNHHPDPSRCENLEDLIQAVRDANADFGVAYDGDGDRIGVVDHHGNVVWNDMLLLMLARHLLKTRPGISVISEVKSSNRMYEAFRQAGGQAIMWRTGHSPIKAKMRETGALLAGEMSGHMFFADRYYGYDDAIYATLRILEMLTAEQKTLPELIADIPKAETTSEIRITCDDSLKFDIIKKAKEHFHAIGYHPIEVDGLRVEFPYGWGLLRASNTEACLMLRFEAETKPQLQEIRQLFEGWLSENLP